MSDDRTAMMSDVRALMQAIATAMPKTIKHMAQPALEDLATKIAALTQRVERLEPTRELQPPESKL